MRLDRQSGELFETPPAFEESTALAPSTKPILNRTLKAACDIAESDPNRIDFHHAVLCQVGIPRKKTEARTFERQSGFVSVQLEAGRLFDGTKFVEYPLPYGTRPRLTLVYASSYAIRNKTRNVEIGESQREFMQRLGIDDQGGKRGNYKMMREQTLALAAARMTIGMRLQGRAVTIKTDGPVEQFDAFLSPQDGQHSLWPGEIVLSQKFYDSLQQFAVPLDHRALGALSDTALGMDIYTWLAHRLYRIEGTRGVDLSWKQLKDQFGQEYRLLDDFKKSFQPSLRRVLSVYPAARIESIYGGLRLHASPPPITKQLVVVR